MNELARTILDRLASDDFPYPVAIHAGHAPELGPVLWADAFDVPEGPIVEISQRLSEVIGMLDAEPPLLPGSIHDFESNVRRSQLPADTVWYQPRARVA